MLLPPTWPPPASHVEMWWDSNKEYLKIVNSSNHDKFWGLAAGRRRRNLAWIWISQHLNGTSRKRCPCAKWPLEQVWYTKSALLTTVKEMLRNRSAIFCPYSSYFLRSLHCAFDRLDANAERLRLGGVGSLRWDQKFILLISCETITKDKGSCDGLESGLRLSRK